VKKTIVHVDQHVIKANAKNGEDNPPLTVKTYNTNDRAFTAEIKDAAGNVVARVVNRPHDPLSCGARVWIEAYHGVDIVTSREEQGVVSDDPEDENGYTRSDRALGAYHDILSAVG
jgi:hypothetical protein